MANEILPFCLTDTGTNLLTEAEYTADVQRTTGNQPGIARSKLVNKAMRQAAFVASQFSQFVTDKTGVSVLDDGNTAALLINIQNALAPQTASRQQVNLGITTSVSANAMTIALKTSSGADATSTTPIAIGFRNVTSATGQYAVLNATAALSITIPTSATLGLSSGVDQYVWVYAINDGGTLRLGVSGSNTFDDLSVQSATSITSGSTSSTILYSTANVTAKAIRLIGRLKVNETVAGTWATNASEISLFPFYVAPTVEAITNVSTTFTASVLTGLTTCDATSGAFTGTMFTSVGNEGKIVKLQKTDSTLSQVTLTRAGSDVFFLPSGSANSTTLATIGETLTLEVVTGGFRIISRFVPMVTTSYTPTYTNCGTVTNNSAKYWRSGEYLYVVATVTMGTVAGALFSMSIPSGLTIDSSKVTINNVTSGGGYPIGQWTSNDSSNASGRMITATGTSTSLVYVAIPNGGAAGATGLTPNNTSSVNLTTSAGVGFDFKIPITGWAG